jgi:uncharacterized protein
MTIPDSELIRATENHVREVMSGESSGHDWWHVHRVRGVALTIAAGEGADKTVVELAALLHDMYDEKFSGSATAGSEFALEWLTGLGAPEYGVLVAEIIAGVSFKGAGVPDKPLTVEGQCVRDADRIDAIGAIGIARTFAYGGHAGRVMYDPEITPVLAKTSVEYRASASPTINHFHEKLLLIGDRLDTESGRELAAGRTQYMHEFLTRFHAEWDGDL